MEETSTANAPYGQEPKASPAVRPAAVLLGVLLLGAAFVAGREVWRLTAQPDAQSWTQPLIDVMSRDQLDEWMVYAGGGAILVGLILLYIALKPRRHTHVSFQHDGGPSTWLRNVDIARRSSAVAKAVPGVSSANTISKNGHVTVTVNGDVGDSDLVSRVTEAVSRELSHLESTPKVSVKAEKLPEVGTNV